MTIFPPPPPPPPPVGIGFCRPTEVELMNHYLLMWLKGQPFPCLYPMITCTDLYADHPSKVFEVGRDPYLGQEDQDQDQEEEEEADGGRGKNKETTKRYFITPLKRKVCKDGKVGSRVGRRTPNGTWKGEYSKPVTVRGELIGWKKYLSYIPDDDKKCKKRGREGNNERELINNGDNNDDVEWRMHEYTHVKDERFALCRVTRIRKRSRGVTNNNNNNNNNNNCNSGQVILTKFPANVADHDHMEPNSNNMVQIPDVFDDQSIMDWFDFDAYEERIEDQAPEQQEAAYAKLRELLEINDD